MHTAQLIRFGDGTLGPRRKVALVVRLHQGQPEAMRVGDRQRHLAETRLHVARRYIVIDEPLLPVAEAACRNREGHLHDLPHATTCCVQVGPWEKCKVGPRRPGAVRKKEMVRIQFK